MNLPLMTLQLDLIGCLNYGFGSNSPGSGSVMFVMWCMQCVGGRKAFIGKIYFVLVLVAPLLVMATVSILTWTENTM